jgi:hypothetical protein
MAGRGNRKKPGPGVDASGQSVVDPTANVLQLVDAESLRQDGLRQATETGLRREMELRAEYDEKLRQAEKDRINAIRDVDQGQIMRAADVQATQALALQAQVVTSAETVRSQLAVRDNAFTEALALTNKNFVDALASGLKPLAEAIAALQVQQNLYAGQQIQVAESRDARAETRDVRGESRLNLGTVISVAVAVLAIVAYFAK